MYDWVELRTRWGKGLFFPSLEIHLVRHGETIYNRDQLVTGLADVPLSPRGRVQAQELADELELPYEMLFSSRLHRAVETLEIALAIRGESAEIIRDSRLNERGLGVMEGKPRRFVPEFAVGDLDFSPPGGESYRSVTQRCMSFLFDLHATTAAWPPHERILVCTHVGPMRILFDILYGIDDSTQMLDLGWHNSVFVRTIAVRVRWPRFLEGTHGI